MQVEQYVMAYGAEQAFTAENAAAIPCGHVQSRHSAALRRITRPRQAKKRFGNQLLHHGKPAVLVFSAEGDIP